MKKKIKKCKDEEVCACRCHHAMMPGNHGNCKDCPNCRGIKVFFRPCNCQEPQKIPWAGNN